LDLLQSYIAKREVHEKEVPLAPIGEENFFEDSLEGDLTCVFLDSHRIPIFVPHKKFIDLA
jgi:hypothetical protein